MSFILHDVKRAELSNNSFESKNVTFLGVKTYSDPHTYFQGVRTPNHHDLRSWHMQSVADTCSVENHSVYTLCR